MKLRTNLPTYIKYVTFALLLAIVSACSHQKPIRIGVSQCSTDDWRNKMNEEILREALLANDSIEIVIRSADDSNKKQIEDLQWFRDNGFDIIAVAPNESEALTPTIKDIYESCMPVIVFDRTINGDYYTAFQGADNKAIGRRAALLANSYHQGADARVLEIRGLDGSTPAEMRKTGFKLAADSLGLNIVASAPAHWLYEDAVRATDSIIDAGIAFNIVYAHNDRMAMGASEVLTRRGMRDRVKIIGIDAAPNIGIKAVSDGTIDATFVYPTEGQSIVRTATAILHGEPYDHVNLFPTPSAVTATNADILLLQDDAMRRETAKISALKSRLDFFFDKYSMQTWLLYACAAIFVLLAVVIFLVVRAWWNHKRNREETEARNAELQRQRDELDHLYHQLEEATQSKLTFFTNVSHDLRTPLTLIADPVQRLAEADNLTERQHTLMQLAHKNVKRLIRLVNQILDIRKYDNSQLHFTPVNIDLAAAVKEWAEPFRVAATGRHIHLDLNIQPDADFNTAVDIDKIERILFNLLSNAFKYTPANGKVTISLEREAETISLRVSDTGAGIKPEDLPHVFTRFHRSQGAENPHGSGIGLALSQSFARLHQGRIFVESTYGHGSSFTLQIPVTHVEADTADINASVKTAIADAEELSVPNDDAVVADLKEDSPVALVIDDNPDICYLVKTILEDSFTVIRAASGSQGIRMACRYIPDLIICDVMMPGMDGYETCRRLKQEPLTAHIPVLLLTACTQDSQRTEAYECGADAFMTKPFDTDMLHARCTNLLENMRRRDNGLQNKPATNQPSAQTPATSAKPQKSEVIAYDIEDEFYHRFMQVVEENISDSELSVEQIADKLGLSRVQMYRKIKATTNFSPAELLRNTRLRQAARLLKTSTATVSEIAYQVGFSSPSYFARCYRELFNESPTDTQQHSSKIKD